MPIQDKILVISLGGSLIVPKGKPDYIFLKKFKKLILKISKKYKVVIVCGGGKTAREYIQTLEKEHSSNYEKSVVGIVATRLNALLLATFFGKNSNSGIPTNIQDFMNLLKHYRIVICGGSLEKYHIGSTSDGTAASIAARLKVKWLINLTNVNGLYNKNPLKYKDARFINRINYRDFRRMLGKVKEKPGQHFVLDRLATEIVSANKINVAILNGKNLRSLENFINGKKFVGTILW